MPSSARTTSSSCSSSATRSDGLGGPLLGGSLEPDGGVAAVALGGVGPAGLGVELAGRLGGALLGARSGPSSSSVEGGLLRLDAGRASSSANAAFSAVRAVGEVAVGLGLLGAVAGGVAPGCDQLGVGDPGGGGAEDDTERRRRG